jgi:hypothetical protein
MTGEHRAPIPAELRYRAMRMGRPPEQKTRYRPATWARALERSPVVGALLWTPGLTEPVAARPADRTVTRHALQAHLAAVDLADWQTMLASFVLVAVWGSGTTNSRSLRYIPIALADPLRAAHQLTTAVETMRRDDLVGAYRQFQLPGIGQSYLTRWLALAGRRGSRAWQPLILDARVNAGLTALGVPVARLMAGRRSRAQRYAAYVDTLHRWADDVRQDNPACQPETLEWLLSRYGRESRPTS